MEREGRCCQAKPSSLIQHGRPARGFDRRRLRLQDGERTSTGRHDGCRASHVRFPGHVQSHPSSRKTRSRVATTTGQSSACVPAAHKPRPNSIGILRVSGRRDTESARSLHLLHHLVPAVVACAGRREWAPARPLDYYRPARPSDPQQSATPSPFGCPGPLCSTCPGPWCLAPLTGRLCNSHCSTAIAANSHCLRPPSTPVDLRRANLPLGPGRLSMIRALGGIP